MKIYFRSILPQFVFVALKSFPGTTQPGFFQIIIFHHRTAWQAIQAHCTLTIDALLGQCNHEWDRAKPIVKEQLKIPLLCHRFQKPRWMDTSWLR